MEYCISKLLRFLWLCIHRILGFHRIGWPLMADQRWETWKIMSTNIYKQLNLWVDNFKWLLSHMNKLCESEGEIHIQMNFLRICERNRLRKFRWREEQVSFVAFGLIFWWYSWKSAFRLSILLYTTINERQLPKSSLFGRISVPSSAIHASTYTKSAINDGKLHFRIAALPRKTNSSITRVW